MMPRPPSVSKTRKTASRVAAFGCWITVSSLYGVFPANNPQCATYQHYSITQADFDLSSDAWMLAILIPLLRGTQISVRFLGVFVMIAVILNKYFNFASPQTTVYQLWYIREASTHLRGPPHVLVAASPQDLWQGSLAVQQQVPHQPVCRPVPLAAACLGDCWGQPGTGVEAVVEASAVRTVGVGSRSQTAVPPEIWRKVEYSVEQNQKG
ncbi:hypothetical protein BDV12DRAFT_90318 [Aspergillus spectabilis]